MSLRYSLYENPFRKKEFMATPRPRRIYKLKDLARRMEHFYGRRYSQGEIESFFECFSAEVERILQEGGSLHLPFIKIAVSIKGKFKNEEDKFDQRRHKLEIKLNPGKNLKAMVKGIKTQKVSPKRPLPQINQVYDLVQESNKTTFTVGQPVKLHGLRMKLDEADPEQGIFLIGEKGKTFPVTNVFYNTPTRLLCLLPEQLEPGTYKLEVRAKVGNSTELRTGYYQHPLTISTLR